MTTPSELLFEVKTFEPVHRPQRRQDRGKIRSRLLLLVYRRSNPAFFCRQYPFESFREFAQWAARKPYSAENLHVHLFVDRKPVGTVTGEAVDSVRETQRLVEALFP